MLHPAVPVGRNWSFELAGEGMIFIHGSTLSEAAGGAPATSFAEGAEVVRPRLLTTFLCCHEAVCYFILEGAAVFAGGAAVGARGWCHGIWVRLALKAVLQLSGPRGPVRACCAPTEASRSELRNSGSESKRIVRPVEPAVVGPAGTRRWSD